MAHGTFHSMTNITSGILSVFVFEAHSYFTMMSKISQYTLQYFPSYIASIDDCEY